MYPEDGPFTPLTPAQFRRRGWFLIGIGMFLTVFMGYIAIVVIRIMLNSNDPDATTRFTGGPMMIAFTLGVFGVVIGFGLLSILTGAWQVRYRKPNPHFLRWMVWMAASFGLFGILAGVLEMFE